MALASTTIESGKGEVITQLALLERDLRSIPTSLADAHGGSVIRLDLTDNQITCTDNFEKFTKLETLVLDRNGLSVSVFLLIIQCASMRTPIVPHRVPPHAKLENPLV